MFRIIWRLIGWCFILFILGVYWYAGWESTHDIAFTLKFGGLLTLPVLLYMLKFERAGR